MKKILIPSLITISAMPLISLSACNKEYKPVTSFAFENLFDVTTSDETEFIGLCTKTDKKPMKLIYELCNITNFKLNSQPYDTDNVYLDIELVPTDDPLVKDVGLYITHKGDRFPTGLYNFDFVFVWYENDDYHHVFEQTISNFTIESK